MFFVMSVFFGLLIGFFGMGWMLGIVIVVMVFIFVYLLFICILEEELEVDFEVKSVIDFCGSVWVICFVFGFFVLIVFLIFNNFIGGVYMVFMDLYGLMFFDV